MYLFLGLLFICLMTIGLVLDYSNSIERGWKPIVDFPKVWEWIKEKFSV